MIEDLVGRYSSVKSHMKPGVSLSSVHPSEQVMGPEYAEIELQDLLFLTSRFFHGRLFTGFDVTTFYSTSPRFCGLFLQRPLLSQIVEWYPFPCMENVLEDSLRAEYCFRVLDTHFVCLRSQKLRPPVPRFTLTVKSSCVGLQEC